MNCPEPRPAEVAEAKAFCLRRNVKWTERAPGEWVILDQEWTPFYWAVFKTEAHAVWAFCIYKDNLEEAAQIALEQK